MKPQYTHIAIVLDKSGSMMKVKDDTIGGYNSFIANQKELPGTATVSTTLFNTYTHISEDFTPIESVKEMNSLNYVPSHQTALFDAVGITIDSIGKKLADMAEEDRPESVMMVIMTDGFENASREFNSAKIKEMIDHQTSKYNWEFVFMGANQDAILSANSMGIKSNSALTYSHDSAGVHEGFASLNEHTMSYRAAVGEAKAFAFTEEDRKKQKV